MKFPRVSALRSLLPVQTAAQPRKPRAFRQLTVEVLEDRTAPAVLGGTISPVVQNWAQSLQAATVPAQQFTPSAAQVIQNPVGTGTGSGLPGLQGAVPAFANFAQA